jgi:hypothetical protein
MKKNNNYLKLKEYLYSLENGYFLGEKIRYLQVCLLSSEKPERVFCININNYNCILKINTHSIWDERDRAKNEQSALTLLNNNGIRNVPRVYYFDTQKKFDGKETLIISFMRNNPYSELTSEHIKRLADFLINLHSIQTNYFTIPFSEFDKQYIGNGFDFVNSYLEIIQFGFRWLKKKIGNRNLIKIHSELFDFIGNKIQDQKKILKENSKFCLLHSHLTNRRNHKHILVQEKEIFIIDWESVCFGEPEYEIATFLDENYGISLQLKMLFLKQYLKRKPLNERKLNIYRFLIKLDDLGEYIGTLIRKNKSLSVFNYNKINLFINQILKFKERLVC